MFLFAVLKGGLNSFLLEKGIMLAFALEMITLECPFLLKGCSGSLQSSAGAGQLEVAQGKRFSFGRFTRDLSCT